ncbi:lamina-associated polypeptide 2, isoforms alpha/zeta-like [Rhinophrynus dorsalis]
MGDAVDSLITKVLDTLHISVEDAPEGPGKYLFKHKTKTRKTFPAFDQLDQIILGEWMRPDRKMSVTRRCNQMYPFARICMDLWETPPAPDPFFTHVAEEMGLPVGHNQYFKDNSDRKLESVFKTSFKASGAALRPNFAIAWVSRAMGQWCDHLVQSIRDDAPKEDLLHLMDQLQETNRYLCDAAYDSIRLTAKVSALSIAAKRVMWLKLCPIDSYTKNLLVSLPFQGKVLFGPELETIINQATESKSTFPNARQKSTHFQHRSQKLCSVRNCLGNSRPRTSSSSPPRRQYQTKHRPSWENNRSPHR